MAMDPPTEGELTDDGIGLALSGGGFRSALFGLGALHYLAASCRIKHLRTITSVSGGSYTNALALLYKDDLCKMEEPDFRRHCQKFVTAIVHKSPWTRWSVLLMGFVVLVALPTIVIGVLVFGLYQIFDGWLTRVAGLNEAWQIFWWVVVLVVPALATAALVPTAGRVLARAIWKTLFRDFHPSPPLGPSVTRDIVVQQSGRLRGTKAMDMANEFENAEHTVHHIFCTTDLHYTRFTYLSNSLVYNPKLGFGSPGDFTIKDAVDASAAIPPIFAPVSLDTSGFLKLPPDSPRRLFSADGGIYDTLATEWYVKDRNDMESTRHNRPYKVPPVPPYVLVLDGSAPVRERDYVPKTTFLFLRKRIPIMWWINAHLRSARMAFGNWDRRNFDGLRSSQYEGMAALSVHASPFALDLSNAKKEMLLQHSINWRRIIRQNCRVPTRPKKLDRQRALELMYHGYVMAWASLEADNQPAEVPDPKEYAKQWSL